MTNDEARMSKEARSSKHEGRVGACVQESDRFEGMSIQPLSLPKREGRVRVSAVDEPTRVASFDPPPAPALPGRGVGPSP